MNLCPITKCSRGALVAISLFWATASLAGPIEVESLSYKGTVPYVQSGDPKRDARINHHIYLDMIGQPAPARLSDGFKVPKEDEGAQGSSEFTFQVLRSDERVLALEVSAEGCGAYCEHYQSYFNFDAVTGRNVSGVDLLTPVGAAVLAKQSRAKRIKQYKVAIVDLNKSAAAYRKKKAASSAKAEPQSDDDEQQFTDAIEMYERCIESMQSPDYDKYQTIARTAMKIESSTVTFVYGRCSNHAMRALDDVGDQYVTYKVAELAPHLSDYGKYLLQGGTKVQAPGGPFMQVPSGRVGQAPITLKLTERYYDGSVGGTYFYDKYRTPILLSGKVSGNTIELREDQSTDTPVPVIRATIKGESLEGQWVGKKSWEFRAGP